MATQATQALESNAYGSFVEEQLIVSSNDRALHRTPAGGLWAYTEGAAQNASDRAGQGGCLLSWDTEHGRLFASYASLAAFTLALEALPAELPRGTHRLLPPSEPPLPAVPFSLDRLKRLLERERSDVRAKEPLQLTTNTLAPDSYTVQCVTGELVVTLDRGKRWKVEFRDAGAEPVCAGIFAHDRVHSDEPEPPLPPSPPPPLPPPAPPSCGIFTTPPNETYSSPLLRDFPIGHRVYAACSACGTGKTKAITKMLVSEATLRELSIIWVTHRKSNSRKLFATLPALNGSPFVLYSDIQGPIGRETRNIIIQYESLHRLTLEFIENPNREVIFIVDEAVSIIHQFNNENSFGSPDQTQCTFYDICRRVEQVYILDGYLDQDIMDIVKKYMGGDIYLVHNTYQSRAKDRVEFTADTEGAINDMLTRIGNGERCVAPFFSKKLAEDVCRRAHALFKGTKKILLFTQDNPLKGEDVNVMWKDADLVAHTGTIDTGVSFELSKHFSRCFAFFDNRTGPNANSAAQMISRARDVHDFTICYTHANYPEQVLDKNAILVGMHTLIQRENSQWWGETLKVVRRQAFEGKGDRWDTCSPVVATHVFHEMTRRQTHKNLQVQLARLLKQDGANVCDEWRKYDKKDLVQIDKADLAMVVIEGQTKESLLKELFTVYQTNCFDPDDMPALERYAKKSKQAAFKNLKLLALNGCDLANAVHQKARNLAKCALGLERAEESGIFDRNAIDTTAISAGVIGGDYTVKANTAAIAMLELVTGSTDAFNIPSMTNTVIEARLECVDVVTTVKGKKGDTEKHEPHLSPRMQEQVVKLFEEWILTNASLHNPFRLFRGGSLSMKKTMQMLDLAIGLQPENSAFHTEVGYQKQI